MYPQPHASSTRTLLRLGLPLALAAILLLLGLGLAAAQGPARLTRITIALGSGHRYSSRPSLSGDGKRIAFLSDSDFLDQGIPAGQRDIWLYDTATMTFTRVTSGVRGSRRPAVNDHGTKVVFSSDNDFLGQGIPDNQFEIWLYDIDPKGLTRLTTAAGTGDRYSFNPSPNANGTRVAFHSNSDFLGQGIPDDQFEIWPYDTATMTVTRVTNSGTGRDSRSPSISTDGTKIAFHSTGDFLGHGIPDDQREIWLYDTTTKKYTRVTTSGAERNSDYPSLDGDGTRVAFESDSDFLSQGIGSGEDEIWLYDLHHCWYTRISYTDHDNNRESWGPAISADGTRIAFDSDSDFLGYGNIGETQFEIWLYDTAAETLTRVTTASADDRYSEYPSLNRDGSKIAFESDSDFLSQGVQPGQYEIWLWEYLPGLYLPAVLRSGS